MVKWGKKFLVCAALFLAIPLTIIGIEFSNYMQEYKDFEVYVTLASRAALQQSQDLYLMWDQSESLSDVTREAARHAVISETARAEIDALDDVELRGRVLDYCTQVETLALAEGIREYNPAHGDPGILDSDIYYYLQTLRLKVAEQNANYNPMQFGLSYVDPVVLDILFQDNLERLVNANYTGQENNSNNFMLNRLNYRDSKVVVSSPRLVNLTGSSNEETWAYEEIFGVYRGTGTTADGVLDYGSGLLYDKFSDYIIRFDIHFDGAGWHNMRSTMGSVLDNTDTTNQIVGQQNNWARSYTVQFPGGGIERYWSIGLPWIRYDTTYTYMN